MKRDERLNRQLLVKVTDAQDQRLRAAAASRHMTAADLIREFIDALDQDQKVLSVDEIRSACREVFRDREDVRAAYLFGSYARGEADATSDVDIALDYDYDKHEAFMLLRYPDAFEQILDKHVDVMTEKTLCKKRRFAEEYNRDKIEVYRRA